MLITSEAELRAYLTQAATEGIANAAIDVENLVKDKVSSVVYGAGGSKTGTGNLYSSVHSTPQGLSLLTKHYGGAYYTVVYKHGLDVDYISGVVQKGAHPAPFGYGHWTNARPYMEEAYKDLAGGKWLEFLRNGIIEAGYPVV